LNGARIRPEIFFTTVEKKLDRSACKNKHTSRATCHVKFIARRSAQVSIRQRRQLRSKSRRVICTAARPEQHWASRRDDILTGNRHVILVDDDYTSAAIECGTEDRPAVFGAFAGLAQDTFDETKQKLSCEFSVPVLWRHCTR
jgi:hypothetical protein